MNSKIGLVVILGFLTQLLIAQPVVKGFRGLSRPEKGWVIAHPFVAKKAWRATQQARIATDSLEKAGTLTDGNGGQLDAFRHTYWMALLTLEIGSRKAGKLGRAHEKGNYRDWKKGKTEEGQRADSLACEMDLRNNAAGIAIAKKFKTDTSATKGTLVETVISAAWDGKLTIVKKDADGRALTCEGKPIDPALYKEKWSQPKCLVPSNEIVVKH